MGLACDSSKRDGSGCASYIVGGHAFNVADSCRASETAAPEGGIDEGVPVPSSFSHHESHLRTRPLCGVPREW